MLPGSSGFDIQKLVSFKWELQKATLVYCNILFCKTKRQNKTRNKGVVQKSTQTKVYLIGKYLSNIFCSTKSQK